MNPNFPSRQNKGRLSLPVNAVVVNSKSRMPGDYYDSAPGCDLPKWPDEVKRVINFEDYALQL